MKALMEGNEEVANAIMMLGKSMRYVLENNQSSSTTLQKELDYIILYLSIQKLRFGDLINYTITVDPALDTKEYKILPLLIQPVVENALLHGLRKMDKPGHIQINIIKNRMTVAFQISDDGCGISPEKIEALKHTMNEENRSDASSIGLRNIYQRIKLYYGTDYDIEIESEEGIGTTITLILPTEPLKEDTNV
jgi:two-component system sensor histidine kinase YesM